LKVELLHSHLNTKEDFKKKLQNLYFPYLRLSCPIPLPKFNKLSEDEIEDLFYELEYELLQEKDKKRIFAPDNTKLFDRKENNKLDYEDLNKRTKQFKSKKGRGKGFRR